MSCNSRSRPTTIICCDCGTEVEVKLAGPVPERCQEHREAHAQQQRQEWRKKYGRYVHRRSSSEDPRELGPERPLLGMTPEEAMAARKEKAVKLYLTEPGLRTEDIAERLGVDTSVVVLALHRAGVQLRPREKLYLPAGLPV